MIYQTKIRKIKNNSTAIKRYPNNICGIHYNSGAYLTKTRFGNKIHKYGYVKKPIQQVCDIDGKLPQKPFSSNAENEGA